MASSSASESVSPAPAVRAEAVPEIPGMFRVFPKRRFEDERGTLQEAFNARDLARALPPGHPFPPGGFVQQNHIVSRRRGVLRGLHCQRLQGETETGQIKLVRAVRGRMLDIVVDVRGGAAHASTYGRFATTVLDAAADDGESATATQVWVPAGCAHGVLCLSEDGCEATYLLTAHHDPSREMGVRHDDPLLREAGLRLPVDDADLVVSAKDASHPDLPRLPSLLFPPASR